MATYHIYFDIRYYNGCSEIEADSEEEAREKFFARDIDELLDDVSSMTVDIESIHEVEEK